MVSFAGLGTVESRADVLPPGGSVHQETNVDLSAPLAPGWARVTCSGPVKASLLYRYRDSEGTSVAEAGVNAAAVPATRFVTFAEQGEGQFGTGVAYANPSDTAAHVTFTVRDVAGQMLASVVRTLLYGGHDAHGMSDLFGLTSFTGSIEVTSTEPIVSLSLNLEADGDGSGRVTIRASKTDQGGGGAVQVHRPAHLAPGPRLDGSGPHRERPAVPPGPPGWKDGRPRRPLRLGPPLDHQEPGRARPRGEDPPVSYRRAWPRPYPPASSSFGSFPMSGEAGGEADRAVVGVLCGFFSGKISWRRRAGPALPSRR